MQRIESANDYGTHGWDELFLRKNGRWRNKDYRYLDEVFRISLFSGTLLDAGCALGDGLIYLHKHCTKVTQYTGTDFSNTGVVSCQNNHDLKFSNFYQHDLMNPLPHTYDNIICLQTIEHAQDPLCAFNNLLTATNKLLIIAVPYKNRRPDENHLWSFDEMDFRDYITSFTLGQNERNIFWLIDRQNCGIKFRRHSLLNSYHKFIDNCNRIFTQKSIIT